MDVLIKNTFMLTKLDKVFFLIIHYPLYILIHFHLFGYFLKKILSGSCTARRPYHSSRYIFCSFTAKNTRADGRTFHIVQLMHTSLRLTETPAD